LGLLVATLLTLLFLPALYVAWFRVTRHTTPLKNGATPRHLTENRYSAGWYQPRQNASSQVLLSRMAEMIKPTIE
jgi:hypothetical protein